MKETATPAFDNLDGFLIRSFTLDEVLYLRAILESPGNSVLLRDYANHLKSRHADKCLYLETMAESCDDQPAEFVLNPERRATMIALSKRFDFPMRIEWGYIVQGLWRIPPGISPRGKFVAENLVRILMGPPGEILYEPVLSPSEWKQLRRRCPSSALLVIPDAQWIVSDERWVSFIVSSKKMDLRLTCAQTNIISYTIGASRRMRSRSICLTHIARRWFVSIGGTLIMSKSSRK